MPSDLLIYPSPSFKEWEAKAAQGNPEAQNNVAVTYCMGTGGKVEDKGKALKLFLAAADKGSTLAQYNIGVMHCVPGVGTVIDLNIAESWLAKVADQHLPLAHYRLGMIHKERAMDQGNAQELAKAIPHFLYAANSGVAAAQYEYGRFLLSQPSDDDKASGTRYCESAASRNHTPAIAHLGILTFVGNKTIPKNEARGVTLLMTADARGDADAQYALGAMYENGLYLMQNTGKAQELYGRAAAQGHSDAKIKLAEMGPVRSGNPVLSSTAPAPK